MKLQNYLTILAIIYVVLITAFFYCLGMKVWAAHLYICAMCVAVVYWVVARSKLK
jgi:hypothetical protein